MHVDFSDGRQPVELKVGCISDWMDKVSFYESCDAESDVIAVFDWKDIAGYYDVEALHEDS
jgi:hypothetical protein